MMKINDLIDRNYTMISVLEDSRDVAKWLKDRDYLVVVDEDRSISGIITLKDLSRHPDCHCVIDCDYTKPKVHPEDSPSVILEFMKSLSVDHLPVYENSMFVGVISLITIAEIVIKSMDELKHHYYNAMQDLRAPINNMQGLINLLELSDEESANSHLLPLFEICCKDALNILNNVSLR